MLIYVNGLYEETDGNQPRIGLGNLFIMLPMLSPPGLPPDKILDMPPGPRIGQVISYVANALPPGLPPDKILHMPLGPRIFCILINARKFSPIKCIIRLINRRWGITANFSRVLKSDIKYAYRIHVSLSPAGRYQIRMQNTCIIGSCWQISNTHAKYMHVSFKAMQIF